MPDSPSISQSSVFGTPRKKRLAIAVPSPGRSRAVVSLSRRSSLSLPRPLLLVLLAVVAFLSLRWILSTSWETVGDDRPDTHSFPRDVGQKDLGTVWNKLFVQDDHEEQSSEAVGPPLSEDVKQDTPRRSFACPRKAAAGSIQAKYSSTPSLLQRGVLHAGSGEDIRRVLKRVTRLSQQKKPDAFRILVLGGSVSNCRGVNTQDCWHSHLMRWFEETLPSSPDGTAHLQEDSSDTGTSQNHSSYRLLNLAKSASGSTFFSYCWVSELELRNKDTSYHWGDKGPDLVVIETGINDLVQPGDFSPSGATSQDYAKDFEYLLRQMKALLSKPAVIVLDAASELLASQQGFERSAEMAVHMTPSVWSDVPVISAKTALMTPSGEKEAKLLGDLFLEDRHHPNKRGHEVLADLLLAYLEEALCDTYPEMDRPDKAVEQKKPSTGHFFEPSTQKVGTRVYAANCLQLGMNSSELQPVTNKGWERLATARDKQYMSTSTPGSILRYNIEVGPGGKILLSWLKSRFYHLGEALVTLDGKGPGVKINGHWDLGWSIGVPTVLFENVTQGKHSITVKLLKTKARKGNKANHFRLIAIAAT